MDRKIFFEVLYQFCEDQIELRALPSKARVYVTDQAGCDSFCDNHKGENLYFGVATRDGQGGGREHCTAVPALWCDIDFKETPVEVAREKLKSFPHRPSITVRSGGGVHLYWLLKEPAGKEEFDKVEDANKRIGHYLGGDPKTYDIPRILRIPETLNIKYDPPRNVEIGSLDRSLVYEIDDFLSLLPEVQPEATTDQQTSKVQNNEAIKAIMACAFMQHCEKDAAKLPEPEWYAMIHQLCRVTGGPAMIHQLSKPYPGYKPKEVDGKIIHATNASRPITCSKIKEMWDCGKDCGVQAPAGLTFKRVDERQGLSRRVSMDNVYDARRMIAEYRKYIADLQNNKFITGIHEIDKRIRGVSGGEVLTILARAGSFKTAFLQNMLMRYVQNSRYGALFFSLEMPVPSVTERYLEMVFGHDGKTVEDIFRNPNQEYDNLLELENEFAEELTDFYVIPTKVSLSDIASYVQLVEKEKAIRIGVLGIDYLGLLDGTGRDEYEQVSRLARGIKDLAKMLNLPVVLLSQVNRDGGEGKQEIALHMGRSSGAIEEAADFVLGMWQHQISDEYRELICRILKNRKGPPGSTWILDLDPKNLRIGRDAEPFQPSTSRRVKGA